MKRQWEEANDDIAKEGGQYSEDDEDGNEEEEDWHQPSRDLLIDNPQKRHCQVWPGLGLSVPDGNQPFLHSKLGHSRTIIHIDLDCFYAQVEMLRNPSLRDKPLGIQQKNIVVTTNYVARARGVSKLSYVKDALIKCPDLVLVSGEDLTNYRETSAKITELLEEYCPLVERLGFDENFLDVTQLVEKRLSAITKENKEPFKVGHSYGEDNESCDKPCQCHCGCRRRLTAGTQLAEELREALASRLGLTSCAGVATNKLLAKLVGGHHKPNDQTVLYSEWVGHFMGMFSKVRQIPGIGHSSGKKLGEIGITSVQQLQEATVSSLTGQFDVQQAEKMVRLAHGIDDTPVVNKGLPQSLSDEDSFKKCSSLAAAKETMTSLLENLIKRVRSDRRVPHTMRVTVRKYSPRSWHRESRQTTIPGGIFSKQDDNALLSHLLTTAVSLFQKLVDTSKPFHLTLINVCFTNLRSKVNKGSLDAFMGSKVKKGSVSASQESNVPKGSVDTLPWSQVKNGTLDVLLGSNVTKESEDNFGGSKVKKEAMNAFLMESKSGQEMATSNTTRDVSNVPSSARKVGGHMMSDDSSFGKASPRKKGSGSNRIGDVSKVNPPSDERTVQDELEMPALMSETALSSTKKSSLSSFFFRRTLPANERLQPMEREHIPASSCSNTSQASHNNSGIAVFSSRDSSTGQTSSGTSSSQSAEMFDLRPSVKQRVPDEAVLICKDSITVTTDSHCATDSNRKVQTNSSSKVKNVSGLCTFSRADTDETNALQTFGRQKRDETESEIPPDIDRTVFDALPSNMKEELLTEWRTRKERQNERKAENTLMKGGSKLHRVSACSSKAAHGNSKPSSKRKSPGTHGTKQNTLLKYFKK